MKKALILGVTGQDGSYLAEFLLNKGYKVFGLVRRSSSPNTHRIDNLITNSINDKSKNKLIRIYGDVTDSTQISVILKKYKPDEVYNLAAQSHVRVSFEIPEYTYDVVGLGPLRVLDAIKNVNPKIKYLQASSSEMFGNSKKIPQDENTQFSPESPYASAKVLGYFTTINYRKNFGIFACNSIMFNHESPRRGLNFVTKKIVRGLCEIKLNHRKVLYLGNLSAKRDWGYAKDYVECFWKIMQHNKPDDFVIATGKSFSVKTFCELVCNELGIIIKWKGKGINEKGIDVTSNSEIILIDPYFFRPNDIMELRGNFNKAKKNLNWKPKTNLKQLISIMVKEELRLIQDSKFY